MNFTFTNILEYFEMIYVFNRCEKTWDSWQHLMRFYSFMMTQKQKQILSQHKEILFKVEKLHNLDLKSLYSSTKLQHIDEFYGRLV